MRHLVLALALLCACAPAPAELPDDPKPTGPTTPAPTDTAPTSPTDPTTPTTPTTPTEPVGEPFACPCPSGYVAEDVGMTTNGVDQAMVHLPTEGAWRDELLVFLHGSGQEPSKHTNVLRTAAYAGFRTIGVKYAADGQILESCAGEDDYDGCVFGRRAARLYGAEYPDWEVVPDEESIVSRVHGFLTELHALEPDRGWDAYFVPAEGVTDHEHYLRWETIVISGFSQGAGQAAMIARDWPVDGIFAISGPSDGPVDWLELGETPACAWMAAHHEREDTVAFIDDTMARFGIPDTGRDPAPLVADGCFEAAPYGGTQHLHVDYQAAPGCGSLTPSHGSMANDDCMNVADAPAGDPYTLFRPYLFAFCSAGARDPLPDGTCTDPFAP